MTYLGKIASNGRFSIVIDHVMEYRSGAPYAFGGYKIGTTGSASQNRGLLHAAEAKISEFLNVEGARV